MKKREPHKYIKAPWIGTLPLFVIMVISIFAVFGCFIVISYVVVTWFLEESTLSIILSVLLGIFLIIAFLNLRIPRKRAFPSEDLESKGSLIATGAWTEVYKIPNEKWLIKQWYFCGWGHNNYSDHLAPVIGKKLCGKYNPLVLWFIHYYMMLYQIIGLRRRIKFQNQIPALGKNRNLSVSKLRYEQQFVSFELNKANAPADIVEQFKILNLDLERSGLYLDDVHARNVRITDQGKIVVVDGELYTGGEEWIKSFLVKLFNGARVKGMKKVYGNERIVAWTDHRMSVEEACEN